MRLLGDRFGGVIYDLQQLRRTPDRNLRDEALKTPRGRLLMSIIGLIKVVEDMDQQALDEASNPRIGGQPFVPCLNPTHDRYSARKSDCSECNTPLCMHCSHTMVPYGSHWQCAMTTCPMHVPPVTISDDDFGDSEQASITSSLANLNDDVAPGSAPRVGTICKCTDPVCNGDNIFPKGCYGCGGIVVKP